MDAMTGSLTESATRLHDYPDLRDYADFRVMSTWSRDPLQREVIASTGTSPGFRRQIERDSAIANSFIAMRLINTRLSNLTPPQVLQR